MDPLKKGRATTNGTSKELVWLQIKNRFLFSGFHFFKSKTNVLRESIKKIRYQRYANVLFILSEASSKFVIFKRYDKRSPNG